LTEEKDNEKICDIRVMIQAGLSDEEIEVTITAEEVQFLQQSLHISSLTTMFLTISVRLLVFTVIFSAITYLRYRQVNRLMVQLSDTERHYALKLMTMPYHQIKR
jgi:hypothetical protein